VGSTERDSKDVFVWCDTKQKIVSKNISYVPALYKIFGKFNHINVTSFFLDEILVNAADNIQRDKKGCTQIKVSIDVKKTRITVFNNGKTVPVTIHPKEKIYVPSMVFGSLLTSSNYNDSIKKVTGGRNGYGAKLTNIYSKKFTVECADTKNKKKFTQVFTKNLSEKGEPKIEEYSADMSDFT
jgi:DNA topoisomerase-2